jgi:phospholipase/carboxylesterase
VIDVHAVWTGQGADGDPLVVALHGYGAAESDLAGLQPFLGVSQQVSLRAPHPVGNGYAWFPIGVPGVPDRAAVDAAAAGVRDWLATRVGAGRPVILLGFSQGGTVALQVARQDPAVAVAVVLLSGFVAPGGAAGDAELADRPLPVFWGRDVADPVIAPVAIDRTAAYLPGHAVLTERRYPGIGHGISRDELADVAAFLADLPAVVAAD